MRLHQLYSEGFANIKDQMTTLLQQQTVVTTTFEAASLHSQTSQLSKIALELNGVKECMDKGAKLNESWQKEQEKEGTKIGEVLSLLTNLEGKFESVEQIITETSTALTRTLIPEHKELVMDMKGRFDDVSSSIQEIIDAVMKPLNESVYKAIIQDNSQRRSLEQIPFQEDSATQGPIHSSVTVDSLLEKKHQLLSGSLVESSSEESLQAPNQLDEWFSKFLQRMDSSPSKTLQIPIASSQAIGATSQSSTASSWFENMDDTNLFLTESSQASPSQTSESSSIMAAHSTVVIEKTPTKRHRSRSVQAECTSTYWDLPPSQTRRPSTAAQILPFVTKKNAKTGSQSSKSAKASKKSKSGHASRASVKAFTEADASKKAMSTIKSSYSIKSQRTLRSGKPFNK